MASRPYLLLGVIIGLILIVLYALVAAGTPGKRPELGRAIALFLAVNGITASIRLFVLAIWASSLGPLKGADRIYLVVGAIAAFWLSVETILKIFARVLPEETIEEARQEIERPRE